MTGTFVVNPVPPGTPNDCPRCGEPIVGMRAWNRHLRSHESETTSFPRCGDCGATFTDADVERAECVSVTSGSHAVLHVSCYLAHEDDGCCWILA